MRGRRFTRHSRVIKCPAITVPTCCNSTPGAHRSPFHRAPACAAYVHGSGGQRQATHPATARWATVGDRDGYSAWRRRWRRRVESVPRTCSDWTVLRRAVGRAPVPYPRRRAQRRPEVVERLRLRGEERRRSTGRDRGMDWCDG